MLKRTATVINAFTRPNTLEWDRCENQAKDANWLTAQRQHPQAKLLLIRGDDIPTAGASASTAVTSTPYLRFAGPPIPETACLLGCGPDAVPHFVFPLPEVSLSPDSGAIPIDAQLKSDQELIKAKLPDDFTFEHVRAAVGRLIPAEASLVAQGKSLLEWHQSARFCGYCGAETKPEEGGRHRKCTKCQKTTYPRVNPVAIMLVLSPDGERCLLGQSKGRLQNMRMYSCLAGFVDQGEGLEDAVRREVMEESGVPVGHVEYHSSQPWPFPFQLMLACSAVAKTDAINFSKEEMVDVKWFTKQQVREAFENGKKKDAPLYLPPPFAIAHSLLRSWVDGEVDLPPPSPSKSTQPSNL
jgi:NADH pyrophosphatase NudC (nudix superfamily)